MGRFIGAMLVLAFLVGGLNYLVQEQPWRSLAASIPKAPQPQPSHWPKPEPQVQQQPVTREVIRYDCSGRPYTVRLTACD